MERSEIERLFSLVSGIRLCSFLAGRVYSPRQASAKCPSTLVANRTPSGYQAPRPHREE
jgi:hypothetical protein